MNTSPRSCPSSPPGLQLVVQLAFAGSRFLFDAATHPQVDAAGFEAAVQRKLTERLRKLPGELGLSEQGHFVCGLSALAIGADTLFTRACRELRWPQRFLLPQQREDFLNGTGSDGTPDFTPAQRQAARELFASPHVIQERVVSDSPDRHTRFQDVNLELVRVSDVVVCLVNAIAPGKSGGTHDLIAGAARRNRPVLEIQVTVQDGQPHFHPTWHWNHPPETPPERQGKFTPPTLPDALAGLALPSEIAPGTLPEAVDYCGALKIFASAQAKKRSNLFKRAALIIIGTHVLATVCAVIALKFGFSIVLPWLLAGELLLLAAGFGVHQYLHRKAASHTWAVSRLVAELTRSVLAVGKLHVYLDYLFTLPFPDFLRPLLRTINVLHLRSTRAARGQPWKPVCDAYVDKRLTGKNGQLEFYGRESTKAKRQLKLAHLAFFIFSGAAILATLTKLLVICDFLPVPHEPLKSICGVLAIILPVLAVAALSLAAAFDLEARHHTFKEMHAFLEIQTRHLQDAASEREFAKLLLETESRLLGETVNWFSRRSFTGVA